MKIAQNENVQRVLKNQHEHSVPSLTKINLLLGSISLRDFLLDV